MINIRESNRLCAHDVVVYDAFLEGGVLVTQYSPLEFPLERRKYEMILISQDTRNDPKQRDMTEDAVK